MAVPDQEPADRPSRPNDGLERDLHGVPGSEGGSDEGQWFPPLLGHEPAVAGDGPLSGSPDLDGDVVSGGAPASPAAAAGPQANGSAPSDMARGTQATASRLPGRPGVPESAADAVEMALTGLGWLAQTADVGSLPTSLQADCLRGLERVQAVHTAARAKMLGAFSAQGGPERDGHGSPRTWLTWQTKITRSAASAATGWMRRLADHPALADALAGGVISQSWARQIADWTDVLPAEHRGDADVILLAAAAEGADLAGLAELAEEIRQRTAPRDRDQGDGFAGRGLRLATTLGGVGWLNGDLSARCAATLRAVLDSLGKKAGPEDTRTIPERDHDALEEACRRLLAAGCLPDRAGQPVQLQLHLTLDQLLNGIGTPGRPWLVPGAGTPPVPGDSATAPTAGLPPAGPGDDCDAAIAPIVTGRVDHDLLDRLAHRLAVGPWAAYNPAQPPAGQPCHDHDCRPADDVGDGDQEARRELAKAAARQLLVANAVALLSGPGGLASWLRTGTLPRPAASVSLPLDVGAVTDLIPPHLRRAIIARDKHCAAPGCDQPSAGCHVHHIVPRSQGGTTSLSNCILLCPFHHLILIHRWGWTITLNPDGTTTAISPDGRVLHSHDPPAVA
jgi:hypothetical protein